MAQDEVILQGFIRCKSEHKDKVFEHVGKDGLFLDHLACAGERKQAVRWISINDNEDPKDYLARAAELADKMSAAIAHRRGGSSSQSPRLGASLELQQPGQGRTSRNAYSKAVLKPPARSLGWLVKATVTEENALGLVAIGAGNRQMMLARVQPKVTRATEVLSTIRPSRARRAEMEVVPATSTAPQGQSDEGRERSPRRRETAQLQSQEGTFVVQPAPNPKAPNLNKDKYDVIECGGGAVTVDTVPCHGFRY